MDFRVLGPVAVIDDGRSLPLGPPRQRLLLAVLLGRAGEAVTVEALVDALWPRPPRSAVDNVYLYVHRLRAVLGGERLPGRRRTGYSLLLDRGELDAARFADALQAGEAALAAGDPASATGRLRAALEGWRGRPYEDLADEPAVAIEVARLEELRLAAIEQRVEADLSLGPPGGLIGELVELVERHPYRERLTGQLMRALYGQGRQGEALAAYRRTRALLRDQLGLEPGAELRRLERMVLIGEPAAGPRPAQLPADLPYFTGRAAELATVDSRWAPGAMVTVVVAGPAGVGKTALAVHWAHRMADRFPDGQVYVNLRGFDPSGEAVSTAEAVRVLLDAFEVPAQRIPASVAAQVNLYRSVLAGKRVLVVLDNARDAEQVRPLLPGAPGCMALVTSRCELTGLVAADGAYPVVLDLPRADEAGRLLGRRVGVERVAAEPEAAAQVVAACGRLPLALAVVAARAITRPLVPLAELAADLREARAGLGAFAGDDPATDVRAVFSWSYRILSPAAARLFRLLGLHPGPDLDVRAAASLAGAPVAEAGPLLAELVAASLLTARAGRFAFHDLLRAYAAELVREVEEAPARRGAARRMLDYYVYAAGAGDRLVSPLRDSVTVAAAAPGAVVVAFDGYADAMAWFAAERAVLVAAVGAAAEAGFDGHVAPLAWLMVSFLDRGGRWQDWIATQGMALASARRSGDVVWQAFAHRALGRVYTLLHRYEEAEPHFSAALERYERAGHAAGAAYTHLNVAILLGEREWHAEALGRAERALALFRGAGHVVGEALALNSVGWSLAQVGEYERALRHCERALGLHERHGNRHNAAIALDSLGYAHHSLGRYERAIDCYRRALDIYEELGSRYYSAQTLVRLADAHELAADAGAAWHAHGRALAILDDLGHVDADRLRSRLRH
ncbi:AfsR/SARP family transcriptional regulator [Micromonospora sp. CPCC 206061]|uniref:AfsR/SARP family transcriptional regulator n=1 Tax=Micromonospora sp. CPCC 206061 TaxID=3122410 RepID=UPI002FF07756